MFPKINLKNGNTKSKKTTHNALKKVLNLKSKTREIVNKQATKAALTSLKSGSSGLKKGENNSNKNQLNSQVADKMKDIVKLNNTKQRIKVVLEKPKEKNVKKSCKSQQLLGENKTDLKNKSNNLNGKISKKVTKNNSVTAVQETPVCKGRTTKNTKVNKSKGKSNTNPLDEKFSHEQLQAKRCYPSTNQSNKPDIKKSASKTSKEVAHDHLVENPNNMTLMNIEQSILEMQNRILKLEQKSLADEEKINTFKMIMLKQRNNDIKMLMDEKENELLLRMDLLYVDYEPERVCKLCLQLFDKKESLTSLVDNEALIYLVTCSLNMEIELYNGTPTGLCDACLEQIKRYDWMKRRSQKADIFSRKFIAIKKSLNRIGNSDECEFTPVTASSDMFALENILEEDMPLKIEDSFSLGTSTNNGLIDIEFIKQEPQSDEETITQSFSTKSRVLCVKHNSVCKCRGCETVFISRWSLSQHYNYCNGKYKCHECNKCFFNSKLFHRHKLIRQSCISTDIFRYCVLCELSFRWKWQLVFHVLKHEQGSG